MVKVDEERLNSGVKYQASRDSKRLLGKVQIKGLNFKRKTLEPVLPLLDT